MSKESNLELEEPKLEPEEDLNDKNSRRKSKLKKADKKKSIYPDRFLANDPIDW